MVLGGTTVPGGKPVTELPGLTPRFPVTTLGPVFVTVEAPRTPNVFRVVPSMPCPGDGMLVNNSVANPTLERKGASNIRSSIVLE